MSLAGRLLLSRGLRWLTVSLTATALLVLLVDWVEHGARIPGDQAGTVAASLRLAVLMLPGHLSVAMPIVVALGAAMCVVGLRRSGEWQALAAAGLGPTRLLAPFLLIGGVAGAAAASLDAWVVPATTGAHDRAMAQLEGRPLRLDDATWIELEGIAFQLTGDPGSGVLPDASAFSVGQDIRAWTHEQLEWDGASWRTDAGPAPFPWDRLPQPELLSEMVGPQSPAGLSWTVLSGDERPTSRAERQARLTRPLAAPLAALLAAALTALLTPGSLAVLLAVTPVLVLEALATAAQSQAALGHLPPAGIPATRLGLALLLAAMLAWRLRRP